MIIVMTTVADSEAAQNLAEKIVGNRLGACVQILPQMTSVYVWEGKVQKENEHLMLIKTLPDKWEELRDFVSANHSYEAPEIVAIDTNRVSGPYLNWMENALS